MKRFNKEELEVTIENKKGEKVILKGEAKAVQSFQERENMWRVIRMVVILGVIVAIGYIGIPKGMVSIIPFVVKWVT